MTNNEAINIICQSGQLSAEALNTMHACRKDHPWHHERAWQNAAFVLHGRIFTGDEHQAYRHVQTMAGEERAGNLWE